MRDSDSKENVKQDLH